MLTKREQQYWNIIRTQYLVLNLKGKPQTAKSALLQSIADKLGMELIDLRLPTMEETDLGVYPKPTDQLEQVLKKVQVEKLIYDKARPETIEEYENIIRSGTNRSWIEHPASEWVVRTMDTSKKFLVVFEEFNRAMPAVRNAAMGVLLERRFGFNYTFGDNVYMAATGNIGTDDGTDVEELDSAQKSRFVTVFHDMDYAEWREWAILKTGDKPNIQPDIIRFLDSKPSKFYPEMKDQGGGDYRDNICGPRTWTGLSRYIETNGLDTDDLVVQAPRHIGPVAHEFVQFLIDTKRLFLKDVLKGGIKYEKVPRENITEVVTELKAADIFGLSEKKMDNLVEFLKVVDEDTLAGLIFDWLGSDKFNSKDTSFHSNPNFQRLLEEFYHIVEHILKNLEKNEKERTKKA